MARSKNTTGISSTFFVVVLVVVIVLLVLYFKNSYSKDNFEEVGSKDVHFITARTYGLYPETVQQTARSSSLKAGGSGSLLGTAYQGSILSSNPLLQHQRLSSAGNVPTIQGDPIRTPTYVGPSVGGYNMFTMNLPWRKAYNIITDPTFASQLATTTETEETKAQRPENE